VIPSNLHPRLLSSVIDSPTQNSPADEEQDLKCRAKGDSIFSGNGRAIFLGILAGALLLSLTGLLFERLVGVRSQASAPTKFTRTRTDTVSASPPELVRPTPVIRLEHSASPSSVVAPRHLVTPAPLVVQISANLFHVSAIALGHPRLAVINGQTVAEGESVTIHTATPEIMVSLRVVKIGDGRIDLSDGKQIISVRLVLK
jgi:hypothetical protein